MRLTRKSKYWIKLILLVLLVCLSGFIWGFIEGRKSLLVDEYTHKQINDSGVSCADVLYEGCL